MKRFFTYKLLLFGITGLIVVLLGLTGISILKEQTEEKAAIANRPTLNATSPTGTPEPTSTTKPATPTSTLSPTATPDVSSAVHFPGTIYFPLIQVPERTP